MSFCASDWEGHGSFPSTCKTKPNFSIEAPFVSDDAFEELYWELRLHQKQLSGWVANAPVQATRDHGMAPLHVGKSAACLNNNVDTIVKDTTARSRVEGSSLDMFDDDMIACLHYPPDVELHVEKMYGKHPVMSFLPPLSLEKSDGAPYRSYALIGAVDREKHSMRNDNDNQQGSLQPAVCTRPHARSFGTSFQSPSLANTADATPGTTSDTQSPEPIVSSKAVALPHFAPYNYTQKSLQSLARLAVEWEPDAGEPSLQAVVDGGKHIHQRNAGVCLLSTDSSLESTVTGISLKGPSVLVDPHVEATSVTLHQEHEAVPIKKPDAITRTDALGALHLTGTSCADGADIKTFSKRNRGYSAKRKMKDSNDSDSQTEDLVNQHHFSQGFSTKRRRAAELHNKSERKRRERINENLKALQELIPNANKTDKASLLGEAIEYLKALQAEIMVMSYRTGITIPPMLIPHGVLYPYVPSHMGMGFGAAGFVMNANSEAAPTNSSMHKTSSLKPLLPLPALPSPARLVGVGNDLSKHLVGYSANCFQMANMGLVSPPYQ